MALFSGVLPARRPRRVAYARERLAPRRSDTRDVLCVKVAVALLYRLAIQEFSSSDENMLVRERSPSPKMINVKTWIVGIDTHSIGGFLR